jgi:hypothetical protein
MCAGAGHVPEAAGLCVCVCAFIDVDVRTYAILDVDLE